MNKDILQLALQSLKVELMRERIENKAKGNDNYMLTTILEEVIEHQKELD